MSDIYVIKMKSGIEIATNIPSSKDEPRICDSCECTIFDKGRAVQKGFLIDRSKIGVRSIAAGGQNYSANILYTINKIYLLCGRCHNTFNSRRPDVGLVRLVEVGESVKILDKYEPGNIKSYLRRLILILAGDSIDTIKHMTSTLTMREYAEKVSKEPYKYNKAGVL